LIGRRTGIVNRESVETLNRQRQRVAIDVDLYSSLLQFFPNPVWIATQIEHGENLGLVAVFLIVNSEWETAGQHAMEFEMQRMNSAKQ
jgi:hypothetical protein